MTRSYLLGGVVAMAATALMGLAPALAADIVTEPEPVVVEDVNNWYVSIHAGFKFGEDWENEINDEDVDIDIEADDGWRVGAAIGYSFSSILSIEGELSYLNQDFDHADCDGCLVDEFDLDGDVAIWTGMVNLIAGFPVGNFFRPYIGGGLGFAHVSLNDLDIEDFDIDDSDTSFAAQAFAGIDLMLTDNMALGGRYRVLHIGDLDFNDDDDDFDHEVDPDLIQSVEAVLTIGF